MRRVYGFVAAVCLAASACAQTTAPVATPILGGSWSAAEFLQRDLDATVALYRYKAYSPIPSMPKLSLEADTFAGMQTSSTSQAVAGVAGLVRWSFNPSFSVAAGIGEIIDLSSAFQLNELSIKHTGLVLSVSVSL